MGYPIIKYSLPGNSVLLQILERFLFMPKTTLKKVASWKQFF